MKKDKWWGYLILFPMIMLVTYSYFGYLSDFLFNFPFYLLICIFCIITMIIYPLYIFKNKIIRIVGVVISSVLILLCTVLVLMDPPVYQTQILSNKEESPFDMTYKVYLTDSKYGDVEIIYMDSIEDYMIQAKFKRRGKTTLILESPSGDKTEYSVDIKRYTYDIEKK